MKRIIALGGGEIKSKTTLTIDGYIANLIRRQGKTVRGNALFFGTASHDSMPYFNSFRKTYTSVYDVKVDVALTVYGEMDDQKIADKIAVADAIYVGGGDTLYMLEKWRERGITDKIIKAYENGTILCGLSAGAICWFKDMYTDSFVMRGGTDYAFEKGLGLLDGLMTPHYAERQIDFDKAFVESDFTTAYAVENDCASEFVDGQFTKSISAGGKAYLLTKENGVLIKKEI
ncbi:MAG: peptidase E [Clostridia bacterium]|nr:peptidase E [Clostridia bacterium]